MIRKSPDKQWNCQNSVLFHETIPLSPSGIHLALLSDKNHIYKLYRFLAN
jgi:hypothetical protein